MNLVGLILIAALSGGIVAVSLRLRAEASARMWLEGDHLHEEDSHQQVQMARSRRAAWLQGQFGLKAESGLHGAVKDRIGS